MLKVVNNEIYLTRGDTATLELTVEKDGAPYDFSADTVLFSIKKCVEEPKPLIQKQFVDGKVSLVESDTSDLPFGQYLYDVVVSRPGGEICTVITPTVLTIGGEVHG